MHRGSPASELAQGAYTRFYLRIVPVEVSGPDQDDTLVGADHEGGREHRDMPGGTQAAIVVAHDGERELQLLDEGRDARRVLLEVDRDDFRGLGAQPVAQALQRGHLRDA